MGSVVAKESTRTDTKRFPKMTPTIAPPTSPWIPLTMQLSCSSLMYTCCLIAAEASSPDPPGGDAIRICNLPWRANPRLRASSIKYDTTASLCAHSETNGFVDIGRRRETERDRETERQRERQRETDRHTHTHTQRTALPAAPRCAALGVSRKTQTIWFSSNRPGQYIFL